jgi:hypothetical protein
MLNGLMTLDYLQSIKGEIAEFETTDRFKSTVSVEPYTLHAIMLCTVYRPTHRHLPQNDIT